jgi:hypothetical protein
LITPHECVGDIETENFVTTSADQAVFCTFAHFKFTNTAIQGFTGWAYERNCNSLLATYCHHGLVENCLLEANGQVFFGGGGFWVNDHEAVSTAVSWNEAAGQLTLTLDNTTDIAVGDLLVLESTPLNSNHATPLNYSDPAGGYIQLAGKYMNPKVLSVNHTTKVVVTDRPKTGWNYRQFRLYRYLATGGTYTLTWMGQTTAPIAWNANAATIQAALEALSNVAPGDVVVGGTGSAGGGGSAFDYADFTVIFQGAWAYPVPVNMLTMTSSLTGGNGPPYGEVTGHFSESAHYVEISENGLMNDFPIVGDDVAWRGEICNHITIRRSIVAQRREWSEAGINPTKGYMEQKSCTDLLFDAVIFTGRPTGIVGTVRNQGGTVPWARNTNTTFQNCIWDETTTLWAMFNMDGAYPSAISDNVKMLNCIGLFVHGHPVCSKPPENTHTAMTIAAGTNVHVDHCTIFATAQCFISYTAPVPDPTQGYPPVNPCRISNSILRPARDGGGIAAFDSDAAWTFSQWTAENLLLINNLGVTLSNWAYVDEVINLWEETDPTDVFESVSAEPEEFYGGSTNFDASGSYRVVNPLYMAGGARQATDGKTMGVDFDQLVTAFGYDPFGGEGFTANFRCDEFSITVDSIPTAQLLLEWTFDSDNTTDTSGNGLHGTAEGSPGYEDTPEGVAAFQKFYSFVEAIAEKVHNLGADTLTLFLTTAANTPVASNSQLSHLTQIAYTNLSSRNISITSSAQAAGVYKLILTDLVVTASGAVATFRMAGIYNNTASNDELICFFDCGADINLDPGQSIIFDFDGTNGLLQLSS